MQYSAMAFQMAAIIGVLTFVGIKIDERFNQSPLFTTIFALSSVFMAIYFAIKDFIRKQ